MLSMRHLWLAGGWLIAAAIFYLSVLTPYLPTVSLSHIDKLYHFSAYLGFMLWLAQAYNPRQRGWILLLLIGFGILIELIQPRFGRAFEWMDMVANSSGALTGLLLSRIGFAPLYPYLQRQT
ncbi:MAG: VanZ family protein [Thiotrichales bacterium]|nr:VanZ family protein [Thiotrichales bacterium]